MKAKSILLGIAVIALLALFLGGLMGMKVSHSGDFPNLDKVLSELEALEKKHIKVGVAAAENSELAKYAEIRAKSGKFLAVPLVKVAKGKSPGEFGKDYFFLKKEIGRDGIEKKYLARSEGKRVIKYYILKKSVKIPERSFMRSTFEGKTYEFEVVDKAFTGLCMGERTADDVCVALGGFLVDAVKKTIRSGVGPANSSLTLSLKNSNSTLMDSYDLFKSIKYEIEG